MKSEQFKGKQLDINFPEKIPEKILEDFGGFSSNEERKQIAYHYKRMNPKEFIKKDGQIYHVDIYSGNEEPVEEWFKSEERLNDTSGEWYI